jgi:hypothetical protein
VQPGGDPARALARRLRALRQQHWLDVTITQPQLAAALGGRKSISVSLVSSWESPNRPVIPPVERLAAYATFFASRRSLAGPAYRLLDEDELTEQERTRRDDLEHELLALREAAVRGSEVGTQVQVTEKGYPIGGGFWRFGDKKTITIVCAQLPGEMLHGMPYADPDAPDYTELYAFADLDALIELHGHIRAVNPASDVVIRSASSLSQDDYTTHLVVLGGVDWNTATRHLLRVLDVPVTQAPRLNDDSDGCFEVDEAGQRRRFAATLVKAGSRQTLVEDVAHFFRGLNPYNRQRTVTLCNGMFSRGTLGVVRALTDARFRERNSDYLERRFQGVRSFSILSRVLIVDRAVVTPDWTVQDNLLHEWSEAN